MTTMNVFYSKENLLFVYDIFQEYMQNHFSLKLTTIDTEQNIKKQMFNLMTDIHNDQKHKNLIYSDKNILLLTKTKQYYTKELQLTDKNESKKPNIQNLSRDRDIYGNRQVVVTDKRPIADPYTRKSESSDINERSMLDRYQQMRDEEVGIKKQIPDARIIAPLDRDQPEPQETFSRKMQEMEMVRSAPQPMTMEILDQRMQVDAERIEANALDKQDPKALFMMSSPYDTINNTINSMCLDDDMNNNRSDLLIPRTQISKKKLEKYITINSFDRNWMNDVLRYKYSVSFHSSLNDADSMNKYRNIQSISVSKVVIPEEVFSTNSILHQVKKVFNYEFSFSYPYLLLLIDEFSDVYDGTNQNLRRAFATLIYHNHYKAPNGRGYVILKPVQKEKKEFFPSPLVSLSKLSLTLTKPNGELFNDSADNYRLFKIEYEVFNSQFIKIITDIYFDKNEFYIGDIINIQGFNMHEEGQTHESREFIRFINRVSGHEIREIGAANDNGFFRSFYIEAPGSFDKVQGKFNVSMNLIDTLNTYNNTINWMTQIQTNGFILNSSLQNSISMTLDVLVDDASRVMDLV